jgi:IclR family transcriptional regulator, acetate operon repressor
VPAPRAAGLGAADVDERRTGTQAIERAMAVLRLFATGRPDLGLVEIASGVQLSPSTTHRIVRALCRAGLVEQDQRTERYQLGRASIILFQAAMQRFGFTAALPDLEDLARDTSESASVGVADGTDVVVVLQTASTHPLRFDRQPGTRVPFHVSAMGKVLLAFSGDDPKAAAKRMEVLARFTPRTITRRADLIAELQAVRSRGWALNDGERYEGVRALAVPLLDDTGRARAAVGLQGPADRLDDARVAQVLPSLREHADRVGRRIHLDLL